MVTRRPQPPTGTEGIGGRWPWSQPRPPFGVPVMERSGLVRVKLVLSADLPPPSPSAGNTLNLGCPRPRVAALLLFGRPRSAEARAHSAKGTHGLLVFHRTTQAAA